MLGADMALSCGDGWVPPRRRGDDAGVRNVYGILLILCQGVLWWVWRWFDVSEKNVRGAGNCD